jgi:hypothetical protein
MNDITKHIDYSIGSICGVSFSELKNVDFRKNPGKHIKTVTGIESKMLKKIIVREIQKIAGLRIYKIVSQWWQKYQLINKSVVWFHKSMSENDTELITMEDIKNIPSPFFTYVSDQTKVFVFDIRNWEFLKQSNCINPYTRRRFTQKNIDRLEKRTLHLLSKSYSLVFAEQYKPPSQNERIRLRAVDLFQYMDELGNYTNVTWFTNMNEQQLRDWYKQAEDVWNYRSELQDDRKKEINQQMNSFKISLTDVYKMKDKLKLQTIVLDEIEKLIKNGINKSEQCLGCLYVLTAFAEVVPEVGISYPWLIS